MRGRAGLQLLHCLGLVSGLVCLLAGCGGSSSSDDPRGAGGRVGQLSLQLVLAPPPASPAPPAGAGAAQGRQGQPGEPGFLERIEVRLQAGGEELAPPQVFALAPTEQETVTRTVTVPDTVPATFTVLVASLNNQGLAVFRGTTTVTREQTSAVVTLGRAALVPMTATPADLMQRTFQFDEGAAFGLGTTPMTLAAGTFEDNVGDFALLARGVVASGQVVLASCTFIVMTSAFPAGQGPQAGSRIAIDPCQVDAIDHRLIATNGTLSAPPVISTSNPPLAAPPEGSLNLPAEPPSLVLPEDSSGTLPLNAAVGSARPATTTFALTTAPAQGTATVTPSGLVTYQPAADFHGSDRLVVTVIVSFADNALPPLLLGTVPVTLTVQPVNDAPTVTTPGAQSTAEGTAVSLAIVARDVDNDRLTFSATGLPPGLSLDPTTGGIGGTIAALAASGSPYSVTVTVTDGTASASTTFSWMITTGNTPPAPSAPALITPQNTPGSSQVSANDPDPGQTQTFSVSTPPAQGTATVGASGLATYTPMPGFIGTDSFTVTVTDNGTPPLAGMVTISVTVLEMPNRPPVPTAPAISTPQNTPGSSQVSANDPDPGQTQTFSISTPPAQGTATVGASGLATYTPTMGFSGTDSFTVTVTDNGTPPLAGTVTIAVTVQPNRAPVPTAPAISTLPDMSGSSQVSANDPDVGQTQTYNVSTPPAQGTATVGASGLATYTPPPGFSGTASFTVTVTDNGTPPLAGTVTIAVTVMVQPNRAPVPTAPAISTIPNMSGSSQVSANDPDTGQSQTFAITTLPANGMASIDPTSGLVMYTPNPNFTGTDSLEVTVTDNGTPPLTGTVTISVTVGDFHFFVARLTFTLPGGTVLSSFFSPLTTTTLQAPAGPMLQVSPNALTFGAFAGLNPPPQRLFLQSVCGEALAFTGLADVPWLSLSPTGGSVSGFSQQPVAVAVDVMGLSASPSPLPATITVTAPAALNSPLTVPVVLNLRDDVAAAWATPAPASVASGQAFPLELAVTGNFQQVSGQVVACRSNVPLEQCFGTAEFEVTPSPFFSGPPGTPFAFTAQGMDCLGPEDFYFAARLTFTLPGGTVLSSFFSPLTTTTLQAPAGPMLQVSPNALTFGAFAGLNPPPQRLFLQSVCGEALAFTGMADVPWLSLSPTGGSVSGFSQQPVAVAVDVMGLSASPSPLPATITVTAPAALNSPLTVPVALNLRDDVAAAWATPAPASVASGQAFPLELAVTGNFQQVSGQVVACRSNVPLEQCFGTTEFEVTPSPFFSGPPGTPFAFTAQGMDCLGPEDFYFAARLTFTLPGGTVLSSFFSPLTTTTLQAPAGPMLQVSPNALTFGAFAGLNPPPQRLFLQSVCGEALAFTGLADVPWLSLSPTGGSVSGFSQQPVAVAVDVMGLSASPSPLPATITVTAPAALNSPLTVPVVLNLRDDVAAAWATPAPASVASGQAFPLELAVTGNFQQVSGQVVACRSNVPLEQCFGTTEFEVTPSSFFSGPPGTPFAFTAEGMDCLGP